MALSMKSTITFSERELLILKVCHINPITYSKKQKCDNPEHTWTNMPIHKQLYSFSPPFKNIIHNFCKRCTKNIITTWDDEIVASVIITGDKWSQALANDKLAKRFNNFQNLLERN